MKTFKLNLPEAELIKRMNFLNKTTPDIVKLWLANRHEKGYVQVFVDNEYKIYLFRFIKSNVWKKTFIAVTQGKSRALAEILWDDTFTKNRLSFGYNIITTIPIAN